MERGGGRRSRGMGGRVKSTDLSLVSVCVWNGSVVIGMNKIASLNEYGLLRHPKISLFLCPQLRRILITNHNDIIAHLGNYDDYGFLSFKSL